VSRAILVLAVAFVVAPVAVSAPFSLAYADTVIELPKTKARLELPDGWTRFDHPGLVVGYRDAQNSTLVVSRSDAPNPDAWSDDAKKRQAHADAIERGIARGVPGYKRTRKKLGKAGDVPALDLEAARDGGSFVVMRVLMFRTYVLALGIEVASKSLVPSARAIAATFAPPKESK
jgi:hypothetical protein